AIAEDREENFANVFAANLLMPDEPFRLAVERRMAEPDPDQLGQVHAIAREFDVSVPAVLERMEFLFRLRDESAAALQVWRRTSRLFEDRGGEPLPDRPDRFRALALRALRAGELSTGRFAEYMGISRYRAMSIARQLEDDGEEVDPAAPAHCQRGDRTS
ncbi:MAG: ImmA/IrrE family metallo-endopeptidase, partial [Planctomycetota bacterium]